MNWTNYFTVFAVLSIMPLLALMLALRLPHSQKATQILIWCLASSTAGGILWAMLGIGLAINMILGGANAS